MKGNEDEGREATGAGGIGSPDEFQGLFWGHRWDGGSPKIPAIPGDDGSGSACPSGRDLHAILEVRQPQVRRKPEFVGIRGGYEHETGEVPDEEPGITAPVKRPHEVIEVRKRMPCHERRFWPFLQPPKQGGRWFNMVGTSEGDIQQNVGVEEDQRYFSASAS